MKKIILCLFILLFTINVNVEKLYTVDAKVIDKNGITLEYLENNNEEKKMNIPYGTIVEVIDEDFSENTVTISYNNINFLSSNLAGKLELIDSKFDYEKIWGKQKELVMYVVDNMFSDKICDILYAGKDMHLYNEIEDIYSDDFNNYTLIPKYSQVKLLGFIGHDGSGAYIEYNNQKGFIFEAYNLYSSIDEIKKEEEDKEIIENNDDFNEEIVMKMQLILKKFYFGLLC